MHITQEVQLKINHAGELLIRAAAVLGTLSQDEQRAINEATEDAAIDSLESALQGIAKLSPQVRESLKTHPPAGFAPHQEQQSQPRHRMEA